MAEPLRIYAKAGQPPLGLFARLVNALAIQSYIPNPNDPRKFALDLSQYEPDIDLELVKDYIPDVTLCIFRICGSYTVKDIKFPDFWPWAINLGITKSMYMYNWPGWTVDQHIGNFIDSVEKYCQGDLGDGPIWVDAECHADKTKREVSDHTFGCVEAIKRETGKEVGVYSGQWFLEEYMEKQDWMQDVQWWLAQWLTDQPSEHPGPVYLPYDIPEENVLWHQTGSRCRADIFGGTGYVDTDRWELSDEEFNLIYPANTTPPDPPGDLEKQVAENTKRIADLENWARGLAFYE